MRVIFLPFAVLIGVSHGFFFGSSGGAGCGCPPPPACPQVQPSPCGRGAAATRAYARGAKTLAYDQPIMDSQQPLRVLTVPDDLDLRAAAFGVPIVPSEQRTVFDVLHNLGETNDQRFGYPVTEENTNTDYYPKENDEDLTVSEATGGFLRGKEIRRAPVEPTVHVHKDEELETTTVSGEKTKVDTTDESIDINKCNSQVLRKLMLENMNDSSAESKKNVNLAAEAKFGGNVDVICSRGHFSYIFTSNLYCEASKGLTTCIAFRQSDKMRRRR